MAPSNLLIYVLRRDLRQADNPILHKLATSPDHGFTHLLPVYVFAAQQIEVSGFLVPASDTTPPPKSPYPEAKSRVGGFWRCGPHRAKFLAESVWDLKSSLENVGSGLCVRVGLVRDVVSALVEGFQQNDDTGSTGETKLNVGAVWMTSEEAVEEKEEEKDVKEVCEKLGVGFKLWRDEKYFVDDRDLPFSDPQELPDIYTTYRKSLEPLRKVPRAALPAPAKGSLPLYPDSSLIPAQSHPFDIPSSYQELQYRLLAPLTNPENPLLKEPPPFPKDTATAHPFKGGESQAISRLAHLIKSGSISTYKDTRNNLLGIDCSTKLSGWLANGCITARQIHAAMLAFEDGTDETYKDVEGYGKGENEGTSAVRFELLWRDYMMLCTRKFGSKLFALYGFKGAEDVGVKEWLRPSHASGGGGKTQAQVAEMFTRFLNGTTGMGLIDASQRELYLTGYTSNRARQNVASFLTKHLGFDWRLGAEWYECMLIDSDVGSNWGNWQYVSGVGSDPRREGRVFNPVKQAFDYDPKGEYVKTWVEELRGIQAWTMKEERRKELGVETLQMVQDPLMKIEFTVGKKEKGSSGDGRANRNSGRGIGSMNIRGNRGRPGPSGSTTGHSHHHYHHPRGGPRAYGPAANFHPYQPPTPMQVYHPHHHAAYGYGYGYAYHPAGGGGYSYGNPRPYYRRRGGGASSPTYKLTCRGFLECGMTERK
ncbi:DASH family cryptochrome [Xylogone sp. PMI_703]|nr:DASH family cryptochrome [Xylogone sp. PMI_703]